jgi:hypothetical protein
MINPQEPLPSAVRSGWSIWCLCGRGTSDVKPRWSLVERARTWPCDGEGRRTGVVYVGKFWKKTSLHLQWPSGSPAQSRPDLILSFPRTKATSWKSAFPPQSPNKGVHPAHGELSSTDGLLHSRELSQSPLPRRHLARVMQCQALAA